MSTVGDQIIEALEEVLADVKGGETGIRRHTVLVPEDESDAREAESGAPMAEGAPIKRRA